MHGHVLNYHKFMPMIIEFNLFSWQSVIDGGISKDMDASDKKRFRVYNQVVVISLLTYVFFIPVSFLIGSMLYLMGIITSILLILLARLLSQKGKFIPSMILFMNILVFSISYFSVIVGEDSGIFLCLIPISVMPLLFVKNRNLAFISIVGCLAIYLVIRNLWTIFPGIELIGWKEILLLDIVLLSITLLTFVYNDFFKISEERNNAKLIFLNGEIKKRNQAILRNIELSKEIQFNLLPTKVQFSSIFPDAMVLYKPRDIVSGDFYWAEEKEGKKYCAVIDCTGHGVPGAFVSILGHQALNRCLNNFNLRKPGEILNKLHELLYASLRKEESDILDGMDMVMICFDKESARVELAGANCDALLLTKIEQENMEVHNGGEAINMYKLKTQRQSLGASNLKEKFEQIEFPVRPGDIIYMYTDGYVDQFGGPMSRKHMHEPFRQFILNVQHISLEDQGVALLNHFESWKGGGRQVDDVCVIGVKI